VKQGTLRAAETGEAAAKELAIHDFQAEPPVEPSWQRNEAEHPPVAAALETATSRET
jgi:hypothetical protein